MKRSFFIFLLLPFLFSMQEVKKESNSDLRNNVRIFSLEQLSDNKMKIYLQSNNATEYGLVFEKSDERSVLRLSSGAMKEVDKVFVDGFFQLNYILARSTDNKCKKLYRLELRGEELFICKDEEKRLEYLSGLVQRLEHYNK